MSNDESRANVKVTVTVGKAIDAALGDALRALLTKPAQELGIMLGDSLGILGDKIKIKRLANVQKGFSELAKKLEQKRIEIGGVIPPSEEDLHVLIEGISLSEDDVVRNLWTGLFAEALNPNNNTTVQRAYTSVLQSMSAQDARILALLSFAEMKERQLRSLVVKPEVQDWSSLTDSEKTALEQAAERNQKFRQETIQQILDRADDWHLLGELTDGGALNLHRVGMVEQIPARFHSFPTSKDIARGNIERVLDQQSAWIENYIKEQEKKSSPPAQIVKSAIGGAGVEFRIRLTQFGRELAAACGLLE